MRRVEVVTRMVFEANPNSTVLGMMGGLHVWWAKGYAAIDGSCGRVGAKSGMILVVSLSIGIVFTFCCFSLGWTLSFYSISF